MKVIVFHCHMLFSRALKSFCDWCLLPVVSAPTGLHYPTYFSLLGCIFRTKGEHTVCDASALCRDSDREKELTR